MFSDEIEEVSKSLPLKSFHFSAGSEMPKAIVRYKEYLTSFYCRDSVSRDDKLSIAPCSEFINLALVRKNKGSVMFTKDCYGGVLASKSPLEMDAILTPDSKFVLVEGPPGIGKSTLCWELCRRWDTLTSLRGYKLVLLLKLRERRVQNATTLNEIFYHSNPKLCENVVDEVFDCEGGGVLLIFDGFVEMPAAVVRKNDSFIMKLISGTCLPKATRLVTSRPSALHLIKECFPQEYRHVEIAGFTDECKIQFANIAFKSKPDLLHHFKKFLFTNPIINSLMYIPINCAIIATVFDDIKTNLTIPKTMTQLYTILILVLIRRHMIETGKWDKDSKLPSSLEALPAEVTADLKRVSELAYRGLFKKGIQLVFTEDDVGRGFQHLGLLKETKEVYLCSGTCTSYSFFHLSIQEFLAAWYVSFDNHLVNQLIYKLHSRTILQPFFNAFGRFLSGILGYAVVLEYSRWWKIATEQNILVVDWNGNYLSQCFYEAQFKPVPLAYLQLYLDQTFLIPPTVSLNNSLDMYILGYCLSHIPLKWHVQVATSAANDLVSKLFQHDDIRALLGSIGRLIMVIQSEVINVSEFKKLFRRMRSKGKPIKTLSIASIKQSVISQLVDVIASCCECNDVFLGIVEVCENDYQLFKAVQALETLGALCIHNYRGLSTQGIQVLSEVLTTSSTLKHFAYQFSHHTHLRPPFESFSVVDRALASPSIQTVETNLALYHIIPNTQHLILWFGFDCPKFNRSLLLDSICSVQLQRSLNCLDYISTMEPLIAPKEITLHIAFQYSSLFLFKHFITIVNRLLNCGHFIMNVVFNFEDISMGALISCFSYHRRTLASALRKDSILPLGRLRRSQSLCDLRSSASPILYLSSLVPFSEFSEARACRLSQSSPDLLEMQALHNIHPLLYKSLGVHKLYYQYQP